MSRLPQRDAEKRRRDFAMTLLDTVRRPFDGLTVFIFVSSSCSHTRRWQPTPHFFHLSTIILPIRFAAVLGPMHRSPLIIMDADSEWASRSQRYFWIDEDTGLKNRYCPVTAVSTLFRRHLRAAIGAYRRPCTESSTQASDPGSRTVLEAGLVLDAMGTVFAAPAGTAGYCPFPGEWYGPKGAPDPKAPWVDGDGADLRRGSGHHGGEARWVTMYRGGRSMAETRG
ncbi:hypothetical protein C8J57DRAFT_1331698 [Mycena rebaudengoi]|nr:hypothetical protein C8J57DRAFT_1331698 [Mycena rebaudengoi]